MTLSLGFAMILAFAEAAESQSVSPYIDAIKEGMPRREEATEGSYSEAEQRRLLQDAAENREDSETSDNYSERIRRAMPPEEAPRRSYTEQEKSRMAPKQTGGAIQALREGRSELEMKRPGEIHYAIGFRLGVGMNYDITGDGGYSARSFEDVYGGKYVPDLGFFYEWQPFHSEWFGNIGIMASAGLSYFTGSGKFQTTLPGYGETSRTDFTFAALPVSLGLNYRLNLLRVVRPYVFAGPSAIGYIETRDDGGSSNYGYSTGLLLSGGVSILLDFFKEEAWALYSAWSVKHSYLTIDFHKMTPLSGGVNFASSGVTAGFTFEY